MIRIAPLESLGGCIAALTDASDGDCRRDAEDIRPRDTALSHIGRRPGDFVSVRQVHGDDILRVDDALATVTDDADALVTDVPGIVLGITVADCIPVYLFAPGRAVGLAHAGRAGTWLGIAGKMAHCMAVEYGCSPDLLHAYIGPGAGPCCYEVSAEIAADWATKQLPTTANKLDLRAANRNILQGAGLAPECITVDGHCTICQGRYYSYRRQRTAARNLGLITLSKQ